jgi:prepilin-type N-terminal cleavage/methylation domain-containing protein
VRRRPAPRRFARPGFTLIEVIIALTLLSIVLVSLAKASTIVAVRGRDNGLAAKRTAALQLEANKFGAIPFSSISGWSTAATSFTLGDFTYTRQLTITAQGTNRYTINIVVVPSTDTTRKDSVSLDRALPGMSSPLCKTGVC